MRLGGENRSWAEGGVGCGVASPPRTNYDLLSRDVEQMGRDQSGDVLTNHSASSSSASFCIMAVAGPSNSV